MYLFKCSMALSMSFLALYNVTSLFLAICNRKKFILKLMKNISHRNAEYGQCSGCFELDQK